LPPSWRLGHRPSLDGLRGIAVLTVIAGHAGTPFLDGRAGFVGVALFFALSGFLITALLLDEWAETGRIRLIAFVGRRVRRLAPALIVFLAVCLVTGVATASTVAPVALYVGNCAYIGGLQLGALAHTWSLSVEEQFYVLWPGLLAVALAVGRLRAAWSVAAIAVIGSLVASLALIAAGAPADRAWFGSDGWAAAILLGAIVAITAHRTGRIPALGWVAGGATIVLVALTMVPGTVLIVPLAAMAAAPVVAWVAAHPAVLTWRWLRFTGRISYGMYLWHYPVAYGFWPLTIGLPWPVGLAVLVAFTYAAAAASWFLVERRFLMASGRIRPAVPTAASAA
jgi:peptidoglycan/LPS O-acetylase OafA/YrhL